MHLRVFTFVAIVSGLLFETNCLIVATYNLWNHMFNWNVRKIRIREMIRDLNADIVAFQEVRSGLDPMLANQVQELQAGLTSQFKWNIFRVANNVSFVKHSIHRDYPGEGLGLLSKLPVVESSVHQLQHSPRDPDKNQRLFLHAVVKDNNNQLYSIIVVHLSYNRQQQCKNLEEIMNFIKIQQLENVIILGDFNTYEDFPWPVQMLLDGGVMPNNPCKQTVRQPAQTFSSLRFQDVWKLHYPDKPGFTFSNMPSPGFESRPDRILISSGLKLQTVQLTGNGSWYQQRYTASVHWERFWTVVQASYLSHQGLEGYMCKHDCGPHGSCKCGVCVAGGNKQDCLLPYCEACSREVYRSLVIHCVLAAVVVVHLAYAVLVVFVVAGGSYGETLYAILGCNCCLMNPKLFTTSTRVHSRKFKILRVCKCWPVFRLPPYVQLLLSVVGALALYLWTRVAFAPQLSLAYSELAEEMFPSDHLMLAAEIRL